jgi:hypothetical protein
MFDPTSIIDPTVFPADIECSECGATATIELSDLDDLPPDLSSTAQAIDYHLNGLGWEVDLMESFVHCPDCTAD